MTIGATSGSEDCAFCSSALQESAFCADERFLAVYNIAPVLPGHSLVLPRAHVESVLSLDDADLAALVVFARSITRLLARAFAADGFAWTIQDGRSAGQSVPHLHLHIIPRRMDDLPEPGDWYPALMAKEGATIDSATRARLAPAEHERMTRHLRECAKHGD